MERFIGVEQARRQLGSIAENVAAGTEPVYLTKHGQPLAVLVSRSEYSRLRATATQAARQELTALVEESRNRGVTVSPDAAELVAEAIAATRHSA